jgi:hypothetical protein
LNQFGAVIAFDDAVAKSQIAQQARQAGDVRQSVSSGGAAFLLANQQAALIERKRWLEAEETLHGTDAVWLRAPPRSRLPVLDPACA